MLQSSSKCLSCVAMLGASGAIGQLLALLLRQNKNVSDLRLYDIKSAPGVAVDLSHLPSDGMVSGYGPGNLEEALLGAEMILIPAGSARQPGMKRDDLFHTNAFTIAELVAVIASVAPKAIIGIITNPLNSMVAVAAAVLEAKRVYDPRKLCGIMNLDAVRARTLVAEMSHTSTIGAKFTCIGGHSGQTIVPLYSQCGVTLSQAQQEYITHRLRCSGDDVVRAKAGEGSSSLTSAFAIMEWVDDVLIAMQGKENVIQATLVESPLMSEHVRFFGSPVQFGPEGVEYIPPLPKLSAYEEKLLDRCLPDLQRNLEKGYDFVRRNVTLPESKA